MDVAFFSVLSLQLSVSDSRRSSHPDTTPSPPLQTSKAVLDPSNVRSTRQSRPGRVGCPGNVGKKRRTNGLEACLLGVSSRTGG